MGSARRQPPHHPPRRTICQRVRGETLALGCRGPRPAHNQESEVSPQNEPHASSNMAADGSSPPAAVWAPAATPSRREPAPSGPQATPWSALLGLLGHPSLSVRFSSLLLIDRMGELKGGLMGGARIARRLPSYRGGPIPWSYLHCRDLRLGCNIFSLRTLLHCRLPAFVVAPPPPFRQLSPASSNVPAAGKVQAAV